MDWEDMLDWDDKDWEEFRSLNNPEGKKEKSDKDRENYHYLIRHKGMFFPAPLEKGDKIALLSPASSVKKEYVEGAMRRITDRGYEPVLMPHALGHDNGSFAATKSERLIDLFDALEDSSIKAILCTRGGYGCCQLLANFSYGMIASNPKWLIGFSDVSALLAMWYSSHIASIHGPMAKHLATMPEDDPCTQALFDILENGGKFDYKTSPHEYNRHGAATGVLRGGNLAVLNDLCGTPYDLLAPRGNEEGFILFIEDISEPIYAVNRMLWRLVLSNTFLLVKGIIFGQFTEYRPDKNFKTMEDMIHDFIDRSIISPTIPIVYNYPSGHTDFNLPLTEGARVELDVTEFGVRLRTI